MKTFSERLKEARIAKGWSQQTLAKKTGFTLESISQFEAGQRFPTPENLDKFAKSLVIATEALSSDEFLYEKNRLLKNTQGLSPESLRKINDFVEMVKQTEKLPKFRG
jgi:transcriptional regulator with XRE-family HTH domain